MAAEPLVPRGSISPHLSPESLFQILHHQSLNFRSVLSRDSHAAATLSRPRHHERLSVSAFVGSQVHTIDPAVSWDGERSVMSTQLRPRRDWLGERDSPSTSSTIICSSACALLPDVDMGRLGDVFDWIERWKAFKWLETLVERLEELIANAVLQNCELNIRKPVVTSHKYPLTSHVVCAHNWRNDRL